VADLMTPQALQAGIVIEFEAPEVAVEGSVAQPEHVVAAALATGTHGAGAAVEPVSLPGAARGQAARGQAWMRGDPDLLKQAVLNLVTNAMEAMKTGGRLHMRVESTGNFVTLEIADSGPGIPPEVRAKVFQLYFTTKERGSGIGLAMTYRAVQLHNGTIEFESEIGRGTTFLLQFPARQAR